MMKHILRMLLTLTLTAVLVLPLAVSAEEERPADLPLEVTIYALNEDDQEYLTIPEELQCWSAGGREVRRVSGCDVDIKDGAVWPHGEMQYWHQNGPGGMWVGSSEPTGQDGEIANFEYDFGNCVVMVDSKWEITIHVVAYDTYYAEQVMDNYLAEHVTEDMTEYQIAELCCQFVASYEYSTDATSYAGMISSGGGDCWASVSTLLYMLEKEGIQCRSRDASADPGAGSGHMNVVALLDGEYYILEAGYYMPAPRDYDLSKMETSTIFTYTKKYVGQDQYEAHITGMIMGEGFTEIVIPSEIDGLPVTGISYGAFSATGLISVTLPDTIRRLEEQAFLNCRSLKSINLPEGLEFIGANCFTWCDALTELNIPSTVTTIQGNICTYSVGTAAINVHEDNAYFTSLDGVLFDKAMETLILFPVSKGHGDRDAFSTADLEMEYTIPDTVKTIGQGAFTDVALKTVHIPATVTDMKPYAFRGSKMYELSIPEGIESIGYNVFKQANIRSFTLPASLKRIEDYAFYEASTTTTFIIPNGVEYVGAYAFAKSAVDWIVVPASIKEIGERAFDFDLASIGGDYQIIDGVELPSRCSSGAIFLDQNCQPDTIGDAAFDTETMCVYPDSYMHRYAVENDLFWYPRKDDGTIEIKQEWLLNPSGSSRRYTGNPVEPSPRWNCTDGYCPFDIPNISLELIYENNINIGTATLTVKGKELLSGSGTIDFTILFSDRDADMIDRSGCGLQYLVEEDHVEIVNYITSALRDQLVIPETLEGLPVTVIADRAFEYCEILTEVTIPGSITSVGYQTFADTPNLKNVWFTGNQPELGWHCLSGITAYYPAGNDTWVLSDLRYAAADEWIAWCENHELGDWVTELEPTCTTEGLKAKRCPNCGEGETEAIPALGHDEVVDAAVAPTCTEAGLTEGRHCSRCEKVLVPQETVTALGHDWDGAQCTRCAESRGLPGDLNADGLVNADDAIHLLYHTLFGGELYPVTQDCDFNGSGAVDADDAIYLLYHTLFGDALYPLKV